MNSPDLNPASSPTRAEPVVSPFRTRRNRFAGMLRQLDDIYADLDSRD